MSAEIGEAVLFRQRECRRADHALRTAAVDHDRLAPNVRRGFAQIPDRSEWPNAQKHQIARSNVLHRKRRVHRVRQLCKGQHAFVHIIAVHRPARGVIRLCK